MIIDDKKFLLDSCDLTVQEVGEALGQWHMFAARVVAFGHCDGWANIATSQGRDSTAVAGLERGWQHRPPHKYLLIEEGKIRQMKDVNDERCAMEEEVHKYIKGLSREEYRDAIKKKDPKVDWFDPSDDKIYFVINAHAGLVCAETAYDVRHGFWTRIVCDNLVAGIRQTIALWEREARKSEKRQDEEEDKRRNLRSDLALTFDKCYEHETVDPIVDLIEDKENWQDYLDLATDEQLYYFYDHILSMKEDMTKVEEKLSGYLKPEFKEYREEKEKRYEASLDARRTPEGNYVWCDEIDNYFEDEHKKFKEFIKSLKEVKDE